MSTSGSGSVKTEPDFIIRTDGKKKLICRVCCRSFKFLSRYTRHMKRHEPPGGYLCQICEKPFCSEEERERHKHLVHEVIKCSICDEFFFTAELYRTHVYQMHKNIVQDIKQCNKCFKKYKTPAALETHQQTSCGTLKKFKCRICNLNYPTATVLKNHMLLHEGKRDYCCSYCGKAFIFKGQMVRHERQHSGERPYKCEICGKTFSYRQSLVTHSTIHTGIKPYMCFCCDAKFSCVGNFIRHRRLRPETCGLPKYDNTGKINATANIKDGTLTGSSSTVTAKNKVFVDDLPEILGVQNVHNAVDTVQSSSVTAKNKVFVDDLPETLHVQNVDSTDDTVKPEPIAEDRMKWLMQTVLDQINADEPNPDLAMDMENVIKDVEVDEANQVIEEVDEDDPSPDNSIVYDNIVGVIEDVEEIVEEDPNPNDSIEHNDIIHAIEKVVEENPDSPIEHDEIIEDVNPTQTTKNLKIQFLGCIGPSNESQTEQPPKPSGSNSVYTIIQKNKNIYELKPYDNEISTKSEDDSEENVSLELKQRISYLCPECPREFVFKKRFEKHLSDFHKMHTVDIAMLMASLSSEKLPAQKESFDCNHCNQSFPTMLKYMEHSDLHGPDGQKKHKCTSNCNLFFATAEEVNVHMQNEHKDNRCIPCDKMYPSQQSLRAHQKYAHGENPRPVKKKTLQCTKCSKSFMSRTALVDHELSNCGVDPIYECPECKKMFHSHGSLKVHSLVHTGELPYKCAHCGKGFRTLGQNKIHERSHTGEKPFQCEMCDKSFAYRQSLITHMSIHTGQKRFKCFGCDQFFTCISNLQSHRSTRMDTCGATEINTKAVVLMGVQKGQFIVKGS